MACCSSSGKGSSKCDEDDEGHCCPVCLDAYDAVDKVPKVLTRCGHTLCAPCINRVVKAEACVVAGITYTYQVECFLLRILLYSIVAINFCRCNVQRVAN